MLERTLERKACALLIENGFWPLKFWPLSQIGLPDRIVLGRHAHVFFIEFKREVGAATPKRAQRFVHRHLAQLGFTVYVVHNMLQIANIIKAEFAKQSKG